MARHIVLSLTVLCGFLVGTAGSIHAGDWPAFRGPQGNGIAEGSGYPVEWGLQTNIKWKLKLPGTGNSSPIVAQGKVFVACATDNGKVRSLICYDRKDGKHLWTQSVNYGIEKETHKTNPYAGATPVCDGERVIVWHGSAGVFCYDLSGQQIWTKEPGDVGHIWGYGSSPILHDGKVILNFGPGEQSFLVAWDAATGEELWRTDEPGGTNDRGGRLVGSWSTPIVVEVDGKDQILCSMATRVVAYNPKDGKILWTVGGIPSSRGDLAYSSPVVSGKYGVAMGGYKGPSLAFTLGGSGDVTEKNRIWHKVEGQPQRIGSGIIIGKQIYIANAGPGTIQCIDLMTGETLWQQRVKGEHWGSLVLADGLLYVTNRKGSTTVFKPNANQFELVAENDLGELSNATPAFSDGEIIYRSESQLYCLRKQQ